MLDICLSGPEVDFISSLTESGVEFLAVDIPRAPDPARCVQTCVLNDDVSRQRLLPLWELKIHDGYRGHRYRPTGGSVWTITPALHRVERGIAQ